MSERATERHGSRRQTWITVESFNGPSSYTTGGVPYTSAIMNQLERVVEIPITRQGLRVAVVTGSVTGNMFRVQFFLGTGVDAQGGLTREVAAGTNLSSDSFWVILEGK